MAAAGAAPKIGLRTELASDFVGIRVPVAAGRCLAGVDRCIVGGAFSNAVQVGKPISVLRIRLDAGLFDSVRKRGRWGGRIFLIRESIFKQRNGAMFREDIAV